jgi:beta-glucanase (GH16 family)
MDVSIKTWAWSHLVQHAAKIEFNLGAVNRFEVYDTILQSGIDSDASDLVWQTVEVVLPENATTGITHLLHAIGDL